MHRVSKLAQTAHSLYLTCRPAEQAELLRNVLLTALYAVSLYPTYRSPFDLIAKRAEKWSTCEEAEQRAESSYRLWFLHRNLQYAPCTGETPVQHIHGTGVVMIVS